MAPIGIPTKTLIIGIESTATNLVGIAAGVADRPTFSASLVYSVGLLTMLGCSAAYNLAHNADRRGLFRRLDHAAIFLMIASTYTPIHDLPIARRLGDRNDGRGLDWPGHRSRDEGDLPKWCRASFDPGLPGARLDDPGRGATHARLGGLSDGSFDRSRRRDLFHRDRLSPLADTALPQRNIA